MSSNFDPMFRGMTYGKDMTLNSDKFRENIEKVKPDKESKLVEGGKGNHNNRGWKTYRLKEA